MDFSRIFDRLLIDFLRIVLRIFDVFLIDFYVIDAQAITRRHCKAQQDTVAVRLYGAAMSDCIPNVAVATLLRPLAMLQLTGYLRKRGGGYAALLRFGYFHILSYIPLLFMYFHAFSRMFKTFSIYF